MKAQHFGELQRMFGAICSAHGIEWANKSPHRLLLVCNVSYSQRDYQEEKVGNVVPKYTISYLHSASLWRSAYSRNPPLHQHISLDCDEAEEDTHEETLQPSASRDL